MSSHTTYTLYDFKGRETNAKIVGLDLESDLCLLKIQRESHPIHVSKKDMLSGARVFYAGYPLGIYMPGSLHHFQGYYSGTDPASFSMFSLPAAPGSSGSPIVNSKGDLISIVSAVTADFDNLTIGASRERIGPFLAEYNH
jgi:S1-C subfamily serine protease